MKHLALILLVIVCTYNLISSMYQVKQQKLNEIYHTACINPAADKYRDLYSKYQWKSDRLRIYTDLVYNVNGGAIYERK